jgi:hypothetical protein
VVAARAERGHDFVDAAPVIVIVGIALITLVAIIIAPFRRVRAEKPLPSDVEARVLLGESPRQIDAELDAESHAHQASGPERLPPAAS